MPRESTLFTLFALFRKFVNLSQTLLLSVTEGTIQNEKLKEILDLDLREKLIMIPLIILIIIIGIFPNLFLDQMRLPIETIIHNFEVANGK